MQNQYHWFWCLCVCLMLSGCAQGTPALPEEPNENEVFTPGAGGDVNLFDPAQDMGTGAPPPPSPSDMGVDRGISPGSDLPIIDDDLPGEPDLPPSDGGGKDPLPDIGMGMDQDGDGYVVGDDCNDTDPSIYPGAEEICGDIIDNNCDRRIDENCQDQQGPQSGETASDCEQNVQCNGGICLQASNGGGYCTARCSTTQSCDQEESCFGIDTNQGVTPFCLRHCQSAADCMPYQQCRSLNPNSPSPVCWF